MLLATYEPKAIMTDFVLCRNLFGYFFSYEKVIIEKSTNTQQLTALRVKKPQNKN